jgi:transcriptional regulator GlxA family with amidase domain
VLRERFQFGGQMVRFVDVRDGDRDRTCASLRTCSTRQIGIIVFSGFALRETAAIVDLFQSETTFTDSPQRENVCYDVHLLSVTGGMIASSSSVFVWTESFDAAVLAEHFQLLLIAGGPGVSFAVHDERLIDWLRQICSQTRFVFPIAEGVVLLEAAGVRQYDVERPGEVSPHHPHASSINAGYGVEPSLIFENLHAEITRQIPNRLSPSDDTQRTSNAREKALGGVSEKIRPSAQWLEANGARHVAIDEAAQIAAMSERNFLRRFKMKWASHLPNTFCPCGSTWPAAFY